LQSLQKYLLRMINDIDHTLGKLPFHYILVTIYSFEEVMFGCQTFSGLFNDVNHDGSVRRFQQMQKNKTLNDIFKFPS